MDDIAEGALSPENIEQFRAVAVRVLDHVVVHQDERAQTVNGITFVDGSMCVGNFTLQPIWRATAVTKPPTLREQGDGYAGSAYPMVQKKRLVSSGNIKRTVTAAR
jgi:hypothetical protein